MLSSEISRACESGDMETLQQLVTRENVNINWIIQKAGFVVLRNVIEELMYYNHDECAKWFINHCGAEFYYTLFNTSIGYLKRCLAIGANPNKIIDGTPVIFLHGNNSSIVKLLLEYGANISTICTRINPLYLLEMESCINNLNGVLILEYAFMGHITCQQSIRYIMEAGAKLNTVRNKSNIPLWAIEYEVELDQKRLRCSKSSVALWVVLLKSRVPKDLIRQIIRDKIKPKWLLF